MKSTAKTLREARELIEKYGWVQGSNGHEKIGFCPLGAINKAMSSCDYFVVLPAVKCVCMAIKQFKPSPGFVAGLAVWNDAPARTKRQVINAFKRAEKAVS